MSQGVAFAEGWWRPWRVVPAAWIPYTPRVCRNPLNPVGAIPVILHHRSRKRAMASSRV